MTAPAPQKTPPAWLFALGRAGLPATVQADGITYRYVELFKHDFFAATALYEKEGSGVRGQGSGTDASSADSGLAVLKIQRTHPLFGLPLQWLGRRIARHEIDIYQRLQGVPGVPKFLGTVGPTGFLHAFVPGAPLTAEHPLTAAFFAELHTIFSEVHARHIAYVDTNKRENILYGDDGRPWLIDFQISFVARKGERDNFLAKRILRRLQRADWYHYYKHKTRLLPGACSAEDFAAAERRGRLHSLHRAVADPIRAVRRRFLRRYELDRTK